MKKSDRKSNNERALEQVIAFNRFDKHQITREGPGLWYCGEPGTGCYHFRVIMVPGRIIVTGDIGDLILCVNHRKPLRWALGCKMRPDRTYYPLSKLSHETSNTEFKPYDAMAWLEERFKESRRYGDNKDAKRWIEMLREWRNCYVLDHPREAEHEWYKLLNRFNEEPIGFRDHDFGTYFRYQALCWFMQHVSAKDDRFKEELKA